MAHALRQDVKVEALARVLLKRRAIPIDNGGCSTTSSITIISIIIIIIDSSFFSAVFKPDVQRQAQAAGPLSERGTAARCKATDFTAEEPGAHW
jgi:hypothetical protein